MTATADPSAGLGLEFKQGSPEWEELRERAKSDLFWFNSVVLGFSNVFPLEPETHGLAHKFMESKTGIPEIDSAPYQLLMWPRETGKSTCGAVGQSIQLACINPDIAILIANEKEELAADFLASIRNHFETNEFLRFLFPEVIPEDLRKTQWSAHRVTLRRNTKRPEATFEVTGVGGTKVGKHFDYIVCDDLIAKNAMESARSGNWDIMEKTNRWVNQLIPLLSSGAGKTDGVKIRFIGTRWWNGDTYEHIMQSFGYGEKRKPFMLRLKLPDGRIVGREVWRCGDLAVMKMSAVEKGEAIFPKIWSLDRLEKQRLIDPEFYSCNLLNDPTDASVRTFRDEWLRYWNWVTDKQIHFRDEQGVSRYVHTNSLYKMICVDPAFTTQSYSARTAIIVYAVDPGSGKRFVLETAGGKMNPADSIREICTLAERWDVNRVGVEVVGQQIQYLNSVKQELRNRNVNASVEELKPSGRNKDMRIETLIVPLQDGAIYFHKSQLELIAEEYQRYRPGSRYRDFLDVLAYAEEKIPKYGASGGQAVGGAGRASSQMQLANYRKRRGIHA